jgi:hypothetical protein
VLFYQPISVAGRIHVEAEWGAELVSTRELAVALNRLPKDWGFSLPHQLAWIPTPPWTPNDRAPET